MVRRREKIHSAIQRYAPTTIHHSKYNTSIAANGIFDKKCTVLITNEMTLDVQNPTIKPEGRYIKPATRATAEPAIIKGITGMIIRFDKGAMSDHWWKECNKIGRVKICAESVAEWIPRISNLSGIFWSHRSKCGVNKNNPSVAAYES